MRSWFSVVFLGLPLLAVDPSNVPVRVHEWGTFTTVASTDGRPMIWGPLEAKSDLPCFVERLGAYQPKSRLRATVRMETPVLYFYAPQATTLAVRVGFPEGVITEWYPKAISAMPHQWQARDGSIEWKRVHVEPAERPTLPISKAASHYFAARETDAAPVRVENQWEKLLFYRGVGSFSVPVIAKFDPNGRLNVQNTGENPFPVAIYFERRGRSAGYRVIRDFSGSATWEPPVLNGSFENLRSELIDHLSEEGLYRKEAAAMVETWRDSWFEEGTRLIYIVPRKMVDAVLPLEIQPMASSLERVFVGRVELLAPWQRERIEALAKAGAKSELAGYGRFLEPFIEQIRTATGKSHDELALRAPLQQQYEEAFRSPGCVR